METKQLNGYKIEFYSKEDWDNDIPSCDSIMESSAGGYSGLVNDINEELAEKIVSKDRKSGLYEEYDPDYEYSEYCCKTAKESFQTYNYPNNLPYCVITKIKEDGNNNT